VSASASGESAAVAGERAKEWGSSEPLVPVSLGDRRLAPGALLARAEIADHTAATTAMIASGIRTMVKIPPPTAAAITARTTRGTATYNIHMPAIYPQSEFSNTNG
jgi:hypothetical protein